jgi:tRNA pseudouridine32 synthase/23S rRNA pseudouridine746 synthase
LKQTTESITILYQDDYLVVADKPSMLLSVPGRGPDKQDCLVARLNESFPGILIVHRLDWETSGVIVLARNKDVHRNLSRQFQERSVKKQYTAIVYGLTEQHGEINLALRCDWENRPIQIVDQSQGKKAQTFWKTLAHYDHSSRVLLTPITGRSHQLRVHMQAIGHPILGDPLYAYNDALQMSERLLLHACEITFTHPATGSMLTIQSKVPF